MDGRHWLGGYKTASASGSPEEPWIVDAVAAEPVTIAAGPTANQRVSRGRECENQARWAADVFDQVEENPGVILSGTDAQDANAFLFIRKWVRDGKSRDDLKHLVYGHCMGEAI